MTATSQSIALSVVLARLWADHRLGKRALNRMIAEGRFPAFVRLSTRRAVFDRQAVEEAFAKLDASLAATRCPATAEGTVAV